MWAVVFLIQILDNSIFFVLYYLWQWGWKPSETTNNKQKGRDMTKVNIPAFYRQDEIKKQIAKAKAEAQMRKYLIDLNDKNIPAIIRQQIQQEIEANPDLQISVLKNQVQMFAEQTKHILAQVRKLNPRLVNERSK